MAKISTLKNKLIVTTALAAAFLGYGRRVYAAPTCTNVGANYSCFGSGTGNFNLDINYANAHVQTVNGFSITDTDNDGLTITGDGNLTFLDTNATPSVIIGAEGNGLYISNFNYFLPVSGSVTVTTNAKITGGYYDGIYAFNYGSGGLTISATGAILGDESGIQAENYSGGAGTIAITTTGTVTGTDDGGIYAENDSAGSGTITITTGTTAGGAISGDYGIGADNNSGGDGTITITANNTVTGNNSSGIWANNDSGGTGMITITANDTVTADTNGIYARNDSATGGGITINTAAAVTASGTTGIFAYNDFAGSITISAGGNVLGDSYGIRARNDDAAGGAIDITTGAGVTVAGSDGLGSYNAGISAYNFGSGAVTVKAGGKVSGYYYGIAALNEGLNANLTISAAGDVLADSTGYGDGFGIRAVIDNEAAQGNLTISVAGDVYGYGSGIIAVNEGKGAISITTEKTVTGTNGTGIFASSDDAGGSVTINASGAVSGNYFGINVDAANSGSGAISITTGAVTGTGTHGDGIQVLGGGSGGITITTSGVISGYGRGIDVNTQNGAAAVNITANKAVSGGDGDAIRVQVGAGAAVINTYDNVTGDSDGIDVASSDGGTIDITVGGEGSFLVKGNDGDGITVSSTYTTGVTITANSDVEGALNGISFETGSGKGSIEITTNGTVWGKDGDGIGGLTSAAGGLTITTNNSVTADGGYGIFAVNDTGGIEINANDVVTASAAGIYASSQGNGNLTINTGGSSTVTGDTMGIFAVSDDTGQQMTIAALGNVTGLGSYGIDAYNNAEGDLMISIGGKVSGKDIGVEAFNSSGTDDLTITMGAEGTVTATDGAGYFSGTGIWAGNSSGTGKITITSNVVNSVDDGIHVGAKGSDGIEINASGNLTVSGSDSDYNGIETHNWGEGATDVSTWGDISVATGGDGIEINGYGTGATTIITHGKITSKGDGIEADVEGALSISAYGDISSTGEDGINAFTDGNGGITVYAKNVTSTTGDGILTSNEGNGLISITTNGKIIGYDNGIQAEQEGTGGIFIETTGDVSSTTAVFHEGNGINASNESSSPGGTTIKTHNKVIGYYNGILAYNAGGALSVTTYGTVSALGTDGDAIYLTNNSNSGLTVTTYGNVTADDQGIFAKDTGNGGITIDTEDAVITGNNNQGISAHNDGGGAIYITSNGAVAGDVDGIYVNNNDYGSSLTLTIGAEGSVTSDNGDGIDATNEGHGLLKVTVSAGGSVSGYDNGIFAYSAGNGGLTINTDGNISADGTDGWGIGALNTGNGNLTITANNATGGSLGNSIGIHAVNGGDGVFSVTANGAVSGKSRGIDAVNNGDENMYITTTATANVTSSSGYGIEAQNTGIGDLLITNEAGATVSGGSTGSGRGINVDFNDDGGTGTLINEDGATIEGRVGLYVTGNGLAYGGIDTTGTIQTTGAGKGSYAIYMKDLTEDTPITIHGGHIIGNVVDNDPTNGHSLVTIADDFTSEGNFDVSDFDVAEGATFTLGKGFTIASYDTIDIKGTFIVPTDPTITGDVDVNTDGLLEINADTYITGDMQNNGAIAIATGTTLEAYTMSQGAGGTLSFGITAADDHAQLITGGEGAAVDLRGQTLMIDVTHDNGLTAADQILLATGDNTLQGGPGSTPETVSDNSFLWAFDIVDGTNIDENDGNLYLVADKDAMVANISDDKNEASLASTLIDLLGVNTDPDLQDVLDALNDATNSEDANAILESLLPESSGAVADSTLTFIDNSLDVTSGRIDQVLASNGQTGFAAGDKSDVSNRFWGQLTGQLAQQSGREGIAGYNANLASATIGMDKEVGRGLLGMAFSYGKTHIDSKNITKTDTDIDSYQATFYSDYNFANGFYLNGMLSGAVSTNSTLRHNVNLIPDHNASADFNSWQFAARGETGRGFTTGNFTFTPMALVDWAYYNAQDYTETGAGGDNLIVGTQALNRLDLGLGAKASWNLKGASGARAVPEIHGSYRHEMLGDNFETSSSFVGGGSAFSSAAPEPARNKFTAGAQFKYFSVDNLELTAAYDFDIKQGYTSHTGMLRAGYKF